MTALTFSHPAGELALAVDALVIAGWTGRDRDAIEHHIAELERLGVPRPSAVPLYYRVARQMLTQAEAIEVLGTASSGEAEPVLVRDAGRWWLTVGSDHTDRGVEAYSVAVSKQMCPKPVARSAWAWDEVADHADELVLRSAVFERGQWVVYQEGALAAIQPLLSLAQGLPAGLPATLALFCGTLAVRPDAGGTAIRPTPQFRIELDDPRRDRRIVHTYRVDALPVVA